MADVALVPVEELVRALSDLDDDRPVVARELRDVVERDCDPVGQRLVLVVDEVGHERFQVGDVDHDLVVVGAVELRDLPRVLQLVVARVLGAVADREGLHGIRHQLGHERDVRRRVEPAGEEDSERDVGHHPAADRFAKQVQEPLFELGLGGCSHLARRFVGHRAPVGGAGRRAVGAHGHQLGRRELANPLEHRQRGRGADEGQVVEEGLLVELGPDRRMDEERLDLGAEDEPALGLRVVEGLLTEAVARQVQLARP